MKIVKRAEKLGIGQGDYLTQLMDIKNAHRIFALDLDGLLNANDFNFTHDYTGIQCYTNRRTGEITNCFVPRFATT